MNPGLDLQSARVEFFESIRELDGAQWNRLAGQDSPFTRHEFLLALEQSGCVSATTGWTPRHLRVIDAGGQWLAVMPLYLKSHSYGEYVFDWSWADAYQTHGYTYYPKLLTAIPFTPSSAPRILTDRREALPGLLPLMLTAIKAKAAEAGASSWHVLFPTRGEAELLQEHGLLTRMGCQFHWHNEGYSDFDGFLCALSSRKRKNIRKERAAVATQGIHFECLEGDAIRAEHWQQFFGFYQNTYLVRGRRGYLNLKFFQQIGKTLPGNLVLLLARQDKQAVAGALFFKSKEKLFGRYWGCDEAFQFLHFETCYYQGIDYCIRAGLRSFDAGAQGEHKIQRGFRPIPTWSSHWIAQAEFERAIAEFLERERQYTESYIKEARTLLPFRQPSSCAEILEPPA